MTKQVSPVELFADMDDFDNVEVRPDRPENVKTFPCEHCGGTGKWRGGRNSKGETKCFACKGSGHFKQSAAKRRKARQQRQESKAKKLNDAKLAFEEENPGLWETLAGMAGWNEFAQSLVGQLATRGTLSDKQIEAAKRMIAKTAEAKAARAKERREKAVEIDLSPIREMFESAFSAGLKRPKYRAEGLIISRAPDNGKNAGFLYVSTLAIQIGEDWSSDDYQGKIGPDNVFLPAWGAHDETTAALKVIAENPSEAAVRWGRKTGNCSCCGRELTDPESIEAGIGPICATKWSL
jgi:hypothetical protein